MSHKFRKRLTRPLIPDPRPLGFTLIELLVVIAIIAILAAILFPVFANTCEKAELGTGFPIVENGRARAVILIGENATWTERHAANELATYVQKMTGARLRIRTVVSGQWPVVSDGRSIVLIGRPETNPLVKQLVDTGAIRLSADEPGLDGYIIQTTGYRPRTADNDGRWTMDDGRVLVLGGSSDIGTLYATYHFLEAFCKVGFFMDGDYVPRVKSLIFSDLAVVERPRYPLREAPLTSHVSHKKYCPMWWNLSEWEAGLDWAAKQRLNFMGAPTRSVLWGGVMNYAYHQAFPEAGDPRVEALFSASGWPIGWTWPEEYHHRRLLAILSEARRRGIKFNYYLGDGLHVPPSFKTAHPEIHYVPVQGIWNDEDHILVSPDDPAFKPTFKRYLCTLIALYGTDHYYFLNPMSEGGMSEDPDESRRAKIKTILELLNVLREVDPEAVWVIDTWGLTGGEWPEGTLKEFLDLIPRDEMYMMITQTPQEKEPQYQRFDYFYGKDWAYRFFFSGGGDDELHGDLDALISACQAAARDPRAKQCLQVGACTEMTMHNVLYFQLAAKLSWDPLGVDKEKFLDDYVLTRYGQASYANMRPAIEDLVRAVYTPQYEDCVRQDMYYRKIHWTHWETPQQRLARQEVVVPLLRRSLELALLEKDPQRDNRLYENDLLDIAKTYVGELCTHYIIRAGLASEQGDRAGFEEAVRWINLTLDQIENILSTRQDYSLQAAIQEISAVPGANPEIAKIIKKGCINWGYNMNEVYEELVLYYRPQVNLWLAEKGAPFGMEKPAYTQEDLDERWVNEPMAVPRRYAGSTIQAIEEALHSMEACPAAEAQL